MEDKNSQSQEQTKDSPLFRKEALEYRKGNFFGKVIVTTPPSFFIWVFAASIIAIAIILFIAFGKYSKHRQAAGILVPNKGLIHIYPKSPGIVTHRFVKQGEPVVKNQPLYLISTEQHELSSQGINAQLLASLEKQRLLQKEKLSLYEKNIIKYKQLLGERHISELEYQGYYNSYLETIATLREIESRLVEVKSHGDHAILAPADGTIATLVAMVGDRVTQEKPLASIIPRGAILEGMLFVSTRDIGFVKLGQRVMLKYDAFPYQTFGLYASTVARIDDSVLSQKDIDMATPPDPNPSAQMDIYGNKTFYRVIVKLQEQRVMVYGKSQPLAAGMTVVGEIIGDRRKIWQWILNPIYTLKGSLTS